MLIEQPARFLRWLYPHAVWRMSPRERAVQYRTMRIFGYKVVMWDLVTRDYSRRLTAEDVLDNVKRYARNGSIITFHDSLKSIDKLRVMLPQALQWLQDQGYEFRRIEEQ